MKSLVHGTRNLVWRLWKNKEQVLWGMLSGYLHFKKGLSLMRKAMKTTKQKGM
jgi:hypothetical protein